MLDRDALDVRAPAGNFFLDTTLERPVVLISGGVGITPMLSMLTCLTENRSRREIWFFFGARNGTEHIEKDRLNAIAKEFENVRLHVCYSKPRPEDKLGEDYQHAERVSVDLIKRLLPSSNYDFFICGPGPMMTAIRATLVATTDSGVGPYGFRTAILLAVSQACTGEFLFNVARKQA